MRGGLLTRRNLGPFRRISTGRNLEVGRDLHALEGELLLPGRAAA